MPYVLDTSGTNPDNTINDELHLIPLITEGSNHRVIIPKQAPYFLNGSNEDMKVYLVNGPTRTILQKGEDWQPLFKFDQATRTIGLPVYGAISIINPDLSSGTVSIDYHTIGDNWILQPSAIADILNGLSGDITRTYWEQVTGYPSQFPVVNHPHEESDLIGLSSVVEAIEELAAAVTARSAGVDPADLVAHYNATGAQISAFLDALGTLRSDLEQSIADGLSNVDLSSIQSQIDTLDNNYSIITLPIIEKLADFASVWEVIGTSPGVPVEIQPTVAKVNFSISGAPGSVIVDTSLMGAEGSYFTIVTIHDEDTDVIFKNNEGGGRKFRGHIDPTPVGATHGYVEDTVLTLDTPHRKVTVVRKANSIFDVYL